MRRETRCGALWVLWIASLAALFGGPAGAATVITEFRLASAGSQPVVATNAPDGNLWFTEESGNRIGRITPAGAITEFTVPTANSQPDIITDGPDGNLWFTEQAGNKIGRIALDGQIAEFPISTGASAPQFIVTGPDGNLWFTERDGNKIGRITPDGQISEFAVPTARVQPAHIIGGSDGNLWFVEQTGNNIGRITPAGAVTEFRIPTASSQTAQIINGPDGNFWFVESAGNRIGRITPTGQITEFALPAGSEPLRIVSGRDGNLWFVENNRNRVARITPTGQITEFALPSPGSAPNRIARGRDTNLWFTESNGNRVGRISYDGQSIAEFPVATPNTTFDQLLTAYDGNLWYVGSNGNVIGRIADPNFNVTSLAAAVLPGSRSVQVGHAATAFAAIINVSSTAVDGCLIFDGLVNQPEDFSYQTTDPATNAVTGMPNTPASIPAHGLQTFAVSMIPTGPFAPADLRLNFSCSNVGSVPFIVGVNTLLLSASVAPGPDIIALGATATGDGVLHLTGGLGAFAVATSNVGAAADITLSADTGGAALPVALDVCQTNPATGACLTAPAPTVTVNIGPGQTPTFGVFVGAASAVAFDAATNRVFARFTDAAGAPRGATSIAVTTQ
jgi:streptogramin lyase